MSALAPHSSPDEEGFVFSDGERNHAITFWKGHYGHE